MRATRSYAPVIKIRIYDNNRPVRKAPKTVYGPIYCSKENVDGPDGRKSREIKENARFDTFKIRFKIRFTNNSPLDLGGGRKGSRYPSRRSCMLLLRQRGGERMWPQILRPPGFQVLLLCRWHCHHSADSTRQRGFEIQTSPPHGVPDGLHYCSYCSSGLNDRRLSLA